MNITLKKSLLTLYILSRVTRILGFILCLMSLLMAGFYRYALYFGKGSDIVLSDRALKFATFFGSLTVCTLLFGGVSRKALEMSNIK